MNNIKNKTPWSPQEIKILEAYYPEFGRERCHELLPHRTLNSIALKAQKLGILRDKYWTKEEEDILIHNYPIKGNYFCQSLLPGRSYNSINLKASRMGIKGDSRIKSHEEYETQLFYIQSDAYPIEPYIKAITPIKHTCIKDHVWLVAPTDVLKGRGCPTCAQKGFDPNKPAILYYISIHHENEILYKIGITNRSVLERFSLDKDKDIRVIFEEYFEKGLDAKSKEKLILDKYKSFKYKGPPILKSLGNSELFSQNIFP